MRSIRGIAAIGSMALLCAMPAPAFAQFIPPQPPPVYSNPYGQQQQQVPNKQVGIRCATPSGVCVMGAAGPLGAACTCAVPGGYVGGRISP